MNRSIQLLLLCGCQLLVGTMSQAAAAFEEREQGRPEMRSEGRSERPAERPGYAPGAGAPGAGRSAFDGRGQVLDQRYNHGRYYPPVGTALPTLPAGYRPYFHGPDRYYFSGGIWYAPRGPGFLVVRPPVGLVIAVLPSYCATVWIGGIPYYYANNVYYTSAPDQNGYVVVDPPANADQPSPPPDAPQAVPDDLIIYPMNGQSKDQQAADRYECNNWAKSQSGFDPTAPNGGLQGVDADRARSNYYRAMGACLMGRGYQVN